MGRPKGSPNKATADARVAISTFIEYNTPRLQGWLDEIATREGPRAAYQCVLELLEYHVPKLQRIETTGKDGGPQVSRFIVETHEGPPPKLP